MSEAPLYQRVFDLQHGADCAIDFHLSKNNQFAEI